MKSTDKRWTNHELQRVREMWLSPEKPSASEIGRRFGVSKHAIIGQVHRMELPGRPRPEGLKQMAQSKFLPPLPSERGIEHLPAAQQVGRLRELHALGYTMAQVAEAVGATLGWVHYRLRAMRPDVARKAPMSPQQIDQLRDDVARLRGEGLTVAEISARLDVDFDAVARASAWVTRATGRQAPNCRVARRVTLPGCGGVGAQAAAAVVAAVVCDPAPVAEVVVAAARPAVPAARPCCWPLWGDREKPTHQYCGAPRARGLWCSAHAAVGYVASTRARAA